MVQRGKGFAQVFTDDDDAKERVVRTLQEHLAVSGTDHDADADAAAAATGTRTLPAAAAALMDEARRTQGLAERTRQVNERESIVIFEQTSSFSRAASVRPR